MKKALSIFLTIVFIVLSLPFVSFAEDNLISYKFDLGGGDVADGYIGVSVDDEYSDIYFIITSYERDYYG